MKPKRKSRRKSQSCSTSSSQVDPEKVVRTLTALRDAAGARIAELEAEEAEHRNRIEILRVAELAAPRKKAFYFRMARLMLEGAGLEIVASWLSRLTPDALRNIAKAQEASEKAVDRGGLKVVEAFTAALNELIRSGVAVDLRDAYRKIKIEDVEKQYRNRNPGVPVPQRQSLSRTLRRKELWRGKPGRPSKNKSDKTA